MGRQKAKDTSTAAANKAENKKTGQDDQRHQGVLPGGAQGEVFGDFEMGRRQVATKETRSYVVLC